MRILKPETEEQVQAAIAEACHARLALTLEGNGTKRHPGHASTATTALKLAALTGITMYEPEEMVFSARAGTLLAEIEAALAKHNQHLAFEPSGKNATIGGIIAASVAGPRRFAAGAARDHLLGFTAVNGKGERFKAGGRVEIRARRAARQVLIRACAWVNCHDGRRAHTRKSVTNSELRSLMCANG